MSQKNYSFLLIPINDKLNSDKDINKQDFSEIVFLLKASNNSAFLSLLDQIEAGLIDENKIQKMLIDKTLDEKAIICGVLALYGKTYNTNFSENWMKKYSKFSDNLLDEENESFLPKDEWLEKYICEKKTNFYHYICAANYSKKQKNDCLIMLKGWSSSTPLINSIGFRNQKFGGGFFVRVNGIGIAVDPGCNFIENMHEQGLFINDIDCVIITHSHIDHCNDMEALATMNYEYNKLIKSNTFEKFKRLNTHIINWYVDATTYKRMVGEENKDNFPQDENKINEVKLNNISNTHTIINKNLKELVIEHNDYIIKLLYFPTLHHCQNSFGFKLTTSLDLKKEFSLGYTSDTAYFDKLREHFKNCDVLIANISELSLNDLESKTVIKDNHLRLQGCVKLLENSLEPPKFFVVSEFWGGKDDIRLYIAKKLLDYSGEPKFKKSKDHTIVFASDVGLTIELPSLKTKCSFCNQYSDPKSMITILSEPYSRLMYACDECIAHSYRSL